MKFFCPEVAELNVTVTVSEVPSAAAPAQVHMLAHISEDVCADWT